MRSLRSMTCALFVIGVLVSACTTTKQAGEACRAGPNDMVCASAANIGSCRGFTWHVDPCRGPNGCSSGGCDQTVAVEHDSCALDGAMACSTDGRQLLRCDDGTMVAHRTCRGERGCYRTAEGATPACDVGAPHVGDPCEPTLGSRCGADGTTILQCSAQTHHFILERQCLGPRGCFENTPFSQGTASFLACDVSRGAVGEPCVGYAGVGARIGNGGSYCSTDGTALLTCKNGVLVAQAECPCAVEWSNDLSSWAVSCTDGPRRWHYLGRSAPYLSIAEKP